MNISHTPNGKSLDFNVFKKSTFIEALAVNIPLKLEGDGNDLKLIPAGYWLIENEEFIEQITELRKKSMHLFFRRFSATVKSTNTYLYNHSLIDNRNILFLLIENENKLIAHAGFKNISSKSVELDNIGRIHPSHSGIMLNFLSTMINWCQSTYQISEYTSTVVSTNDKAVSLYYKLGFLPFREFNLRSETDSFGNLILIECEKSKSNVNEKKLVLKKLVTN